MRTQSCILGLAMLLSVPLCVSAQQPELVHAQLTSRRAKGGLAAELGSLKRGSAPVWVGYSISVTEGFHSGWNDDAVAYLENDRDLPEAAR